MIPSRVAIIQRRLGTNLSREKIVPPRISRNFSYDRIFMSYEKTEISPQKMIFRREKIILPHENFARQPAPGIGRGGLAVPHQTVA
ncbi:MAG: hypothetical protein JSR83_08735 [Proteobacteria bacterium]|nr:hypothetical protein [Pseudomonadota bacterium]